MNKTVLTSANYTGAELGDIIKISYPHKYWWQKLYRVTSVTNDSFEIVPLGFWATLWFHIRQFKIKGKP